MADHPPFAVTADLVVLAVRDDERPRAAGAPGWRAVRRLVGAARRVRGDRRGRRRGRRPRAGRGDRPGRRRPAPGAAAGGRRARARPARARGLGAVAGPGRGAGRRGRRRRRRGRCAGYRWPRPWRTPTSRRWPSTTPACWPERSRAPRATWRAARGPWRCWAPTHRCHGSGRCARPWPGRWVRSILSGQAVTGTGERRCKAAPGRDGAPARITGRGRCALLTPGSHQVSAAVRADGCPRPAGPSGPG